MNPIAKALGSAALLIALNGTFAATHYVDANNLAPGTPFISWGSAANTIQDAVEVAAAGDEIIVTNGVYFTGGKAIYNGFTNRVAVDKPVVVRSVNGPQFTVIQGYQVPEATNGPTAVRCAYLTNGASLTGFTLTQGGSLAGLASTNDNFHQQAGGGLWCESVDAVATNCWLIRNAAADAGGGAFSGALYNCTLSNNVAMNGGGASGSTLYNCHLTGNVAVFGGGASGGNLAGCNLASNRGVLGGGANGGLLNRCTLVGNSAADVQFGDVIYSGGHGGGAYSSVLNNCLLTGNSAKYRGGGAATGGLNNCTLADNSAMEAGGGASGVSFFSGSIAYCTLNNCIVFSNSAPTGLNFETNCLLNYCCTTPLPPAGSGNITSDPRWIDLAGGNLRLQSNSPCIDSGNNTYAPAGTDLDGHPRINGASVDIGAYEFYSSPTLRITQSANSVILAWPLWGSNFVLQQAGNLPSTPSGWSNVLTEVTAMGGEKVVTLPANEVSKYFRLSLP